MSTTVTYKGNTITTVNNETRTLLTQDKWVEDDIVITDESRGGGVDTETDPVFSVSPAAGITQSDIINWNTKSNFSGNYNDLTNKPTIPAAQVSSDWNATSGIAQILHKPTLSDVATSGDYEDLINKPNIPTAVSDLNNDKGFITTEIDPVFSVSPAAGITSNDITSWNNKSDFSGSYNDLTDKPTIAGQVNSDWNANSGVAKILNKPTLAYVAMSGNYNDLTNKPVLDTSLSTASTRAVENQAISIALEGKASKQYVDTAISNIPSPMVFKGSLGTSGTITTLPSADATNTGFTYKVIQAGTYASQAAEIGDIFISDGTTWILVPSGDDIANVVVTPVQSSGTKIAVVTVNNTSTDLYAPTPVAPPNASTLAPNIDGTAAAGTSTSYARADHIHPVDTSRASANDVSSLTTRVGSLETAIGTGGSVDNKIATAIQGLDSSITATSGEAISAITITDGKITTSSKITIPTYSVATTAANGLMSAADKAKINALSTVDNNTTYANATTASDGLMSSADKTKLDTFRPLLYVKDGNNVSVLLGNTAQNVASGDYSIAEGYQTTASGLYSHAEGEGTLANDWRAHAEGLHTTAAGEAAHAEGICTLASTQAAHVEGNSSTAGGEASHAQGYYTKTIGNYAHTEGKSTISSGMSAHAEGGYTVASSTYSHAEGNGTTASALNSHAEGYHTQAINNPNCHAQGYATVSSGNGSHAEGNAATASAYATHAEGEGTYASAQAAHAEGKMSIASGSQSHAEGNMTTASGFSAHSEGSITLASEEEAHAEGYNSVASGYYSHAQGYKTFANIKAAHAEGRASTASGNYSHAEGYQTKASYDQAHAEGWQTLASKAAAHAEGQATTASGVAAHAEGFNTLASTVYTHAEGNLTTASGNYSHSEGTGSFASGLAAHAEGDRAHATTYAAHAEGQETVASGKAAHAEGLATTAFGEKSHAEGSYTYSLGFNAHSEGNHTYASGNYSHTEGLYTTASAECAHTNGRYIIATRDDQTVIGRYNKTTLDNNTTVSTDAAFVIGNGASTAARSDAFAVKWDGTLVFANGAELSPAQVTQLLALLN